MSIDRETNAAVELLGEPGHDPNFLPVEAERAAEGHPHTVAESELEAKELLGEFGHDPNFFPVEAARIMRAAQD